MTTWIKLFCWDYVDLTKQANKISYGYVGGFILVKVVSWRNNGMNKENIYDEFKSLDKIVFEILKINNEMYILVEKYL